jgi:hypothetical protein
MDWIAVIVFLLSAIGIKEVLGIHFSWEQCPCCGRPYSEHGGSDNDINDIQVE